MCFAAPAGAPAVLGRRHECGRVQGWGPSRKIPARAPPAEGSRLQWLLGNPFGLRDRWELHFPAATVNASLPLVALGRNLPARPHPCTRPAFMPAPQHCWGARRCGKAHRAINLKRPAFALDHIHAGAPAWPVRPPLRQSYRG
ncbi:hypothetical protein NDU88_006394 [Pleurodeles waltl]|uniref:Uncharacterized protein n=1 Tax=Pleurodeles waltl TaxID=8319 RepID=A0AAV7NRP3_PLEWA|nr:hypothetical protein NDU88_006394 [Pleurodeles waltl]